MHSNSVFQVILAACLLQSSFAFLTPLTKHAPACRATANVGPRFTTLFSEEASTTEAAEESSEAAEAPTPERHTLFVGNLDFEASDSQVQEIFAAHGKVELVSLPRNRETGKCRGFAFVDMSTADEAKSAIEALHGTEINGRTIRVQESLPKEEAKKQARKNEQMEGGTKIYVGNLPFDASKDEIMDVYGQYGVKDLYIPVNRDTGEPRGFAFITVDKENAEKAIEETNGVEFGGRELAVSLPLPPGEKRKFRETFTDRTKLYVGNLSFYTHPDTLRAVFEEFGTVHDCYMPEDPETGGSRGFGFVTVDAEAADAAINGSDGMEIDGRMIRVNAAQPKGRRVSNDEYDP